MKQQRWGGLIWLLLGVYLCLSSIALKLGTLHKPGPGFISFISGALLVVLGIMLMFSRTGSAGAGFFSREFWHNWPNFVIPLGALFGYLVLMQPLGFIPTSFVFLFILFKLFQPKSWLKPLMFSAVTSVVTYYVLSVWLQCQFPKGILTFLPR